MGSLGDDASIVVCEARNRIGGRMCTDSTIGVKGDAHPISIDLGEANI